MRFHRLTLLPAILISLCPTLLSEVMPAERKTAARHARQQTPPPKPSAKADLSSRYALGCNGAFFNIPGNNYVAYGHYPEAPVPGTSQQLATCALTAPGYSLLGLRGRLN